MSIKNNKHWASFYGSQLAFWTLHKGVKGFTECGWVEIISTPFKVPYIDSKMVKVYVPNVGIINYAYLDELTAYGPVAKELIENFK